MSVLQVVQPRGGQQPACLGHFKCLTPICFQVVGAGTLFISDNSQALIGSSDDGVIDAIQLNQASGVTTIWFEGDVYVAGSVQFKAVIYKPNLGNAASGLNRSSTGSGSGQGGV